MLLELFLLFLKVGLISFGGGYAVIALIQREITEKGWVTAGHFQELVAMAGMAPGSIATNTATLIGYSQMGLLGGAVSTIGIILPSLLIVILLTAFFCGCTAITGYGPLFTDYVPLLPASSHMLPFISS